MFKKILQSFFLIFLILLSYKIFKHENFYLLQNTNLIFHEAGHTLFIFFGKFLHILGGTIGQLFFPTLFFFYFLKRNDYFSSAIMFWWLGENLTEVGIYMADARAQALPLLGGDKSGHDWTNLFSMFNILPYDTAIGNFTWWTGIILMIIGISFAIYTIIKNKKVDIPFTDFSI